MYKIYFRPVALLLWIIFCQSCSNHSINLPLITPIVKAATPTGFGGDSGTVAQSALQTVASPDPTEPNPPASNIAFSAQDIKDRFFMDGPTSIPGLLKNIDKIISDINLQTGDCIIQTPIAYQVTPFGQPVTLYAQCYQTYSSSDFFQFGVKDNIIYIASMVGQGRAILILSPLDANGKPATVSVFTPPRPKGSDYTPTPKLTQIQNTYQVELFGTVGSLNASSCPYGKAWDACSYGVMHLIANSVTKTFELTVAGNGFGFCGASLKSDGSNIYISGSFDAAVCQPINTLCVAASDATTPATCSSDLLQFTLNGLGRKSAKSSGLATNPQDTQGPDIYSASSYPTAGGNVLLDGTISDDMNFGPTTPTAGAGKL